MSIMSQCCGLALVVAIMFFYFYRKRIISKTGTNYIQLLFITAICTLMDIASIFAIENEAVLPEIFVKFVCKLYIVCLLWVTAFGIRYLLADMYGNTKGYFIRNVILMSALLTESAVVFLTPILIFYDEAGVAKYTQGISVTLTYIFAAFNIIFLIFVIIKNSHKIIRRRKFAIILWFSVWVGVTVIQFLFSDILVVSFGACLGAAIIYLALENPEVNIDRLTGFFNENAFTEFSNTRFRSGKPFSMIAVYVDDLGDEDTTVISGNMTVRREIFNYLSAMENAQIFRNGLNEVYLVYEDARFARKKIKELVTRFRMGWGKDNKELITYSFVYVPDTNILKDADELSSVMRFALANGKPSKDGVVLISPNLIAEMSKEHATQELIVRAIENNLVEVFYQPMLNINKNKYTHAEALVRIRKEDGTIVPPSMFIDVAERNSKINAIGYMIFEQVCRFVSSEAFAKSEVDVIEVNLSTVQCSTAGLADKLIKTMKKYNVNPANIVFEITETEAITSEEIFEQNINRLRDYGFELALDDFGTGHSNLNYIMKMPIDMVKFDISLTREYFKNDKAKHIMANVIKMLKDMKLHVVAEGIENDRMSKEMKRIGVDILQGYYYSKPICQEEYIKFLENRNKV